MMLYESSRTRKSKRREYSVLSDAISGIEDLSASDGYTFCDYDIKSLLL